MLLSHLKSLFLFSASLAYSFHLPYPRKGHERAAYFLDSDTSGNKLISLKISHDDGTLSSPVRTPTGGKGLSDIVAVSSDSIVVSGNVRYRFLCPLSMDGLTIASHSTYLSSIQPQTPFRCSPSIPRTPITQNFSASLNRPWAKRRSLLLTLISSRLVRTQIGLPLSCSSSADLQQHASPMLVPPPV